MGDATTHPVSEDAMCSLVEPPEADSYQVVVIPFELELNDAESTGINADTQVYLRWLDTNKDWTELGRVVGYRMETVEGKNDQPTGWNATTYHVESGGVVSQEEYVEAPESAESDGAAPNKIIGPPPAGGCDDGFCLGLESPCGWDWACVLNIASVYGQVAGCAGCSPSSPLLCSQCLGAVYNGIYDPPECDPAPDCDMVYACDPCFCENPIPPGC